jgi:hypothetical protein
MPGDDLTHGPPATKKAGGSHHRFGRINRHSLRDGVTVYIALSPVTFAWLPPSSLRSLLLKNLAPASERQDHTTSPSASGHVRLTCPQRPPHPRPTYRDDRPKRPSSSRRDAREHRCDLPDGASADTCDRLARRAIRAWHACGNCPSGSSVHAHDRGLKECGLHSRQRAHRQRDRPSLIHCKRPHISSATNGDHFGTLETRRGL